MGRQINQSLACCAMLCRNRITPGIESRLQCNARHPPAEIYGRKSRTVSEALPACNIVYITGNEMKNKLSGYLNVLFEQNPKAVGGNVPGDDFYYAD